MEANILNGGFRLDVVTTPYIPTLYLAVIWSTGTIASVAAARARLNPGISLENK